MDIGVHGGKIVQITGANHVERGERLHALWRPLAYLQANLFANIAQIGQCDVIANCLETVSFRSARLMNLPDCDVEVGAPAHLVVIDATQPTMAVAEPLQPMYGFKRGMPVLTHALPEMHLP